MALNPPVLAGGLPAGIVGEWFCLQRKGVVLKLTSESLGKIEAKGSLVVTTVRMCFLPSEPTVFTGLDIPLQGITDEAFEQPIFGANALQGTVAPVPGRGLDRPARFRLQFNEGGCGTFLHVFFALLERHRKATDEAARQAFFSAPRAVESFIQEQQAYVDPSDPSVLFVVQPAAVAQPQPQPQPYGGPTFAQAPNAGWGSPGPGAPAAATMQQAGPSYGAAPGPSGAPSAPPPGWGGGWAPGGPSGYAPPASYGGAGMPAAQQPQNPAYYAGPQGGPVAYPPQSVGGAYYNPQPAYMGGGGRGGGPPQQLPLHTHAAPLVCGIV